MPTELDEDATRAPRRAAARRRRVRGRLVRVQRRAAGAARRVVPGRAPARPRRWSGSSGSGKSTLISLVMAFNRPTQGRVLDRRPRPGRPAADATTASSWRRCCRRTSCSTARSPRTSATRKPGATLDEIKEACRIAHCDEFISQFPEGYDTVVGERGIKLSGGQRQRVSIARAILANPRILILDEATSSLDSESEQMIQDGLRQLRSGRTTFVIAHRLSTIRSADQILVLEAGEIVERGTHAELLALNGRYRQLLRQAVQVRGRSVHQPRRGLHAGAREAGGAAPRVGSAICNYGRHAMLCQRRAARRARRAATARSRRALSYLTGRRRRIASGEPDDAADGGRRGVGHLRDAAAEPGPPGSRRRRAAPPVPVPRRTAPPASMPPLPDAGAPAAAPIERRAADGAAGDLGGASRRRDERAGARGDPASRRRTPASAERRRARAGAAAAAGRDRGRRHRSGAAGDALRAGVHRACAPTNRSSGAERIYLAQLAHLLGLDPATVQQLEATRRADRRARAIRTAECRRTCRSATCS